MFTMGAGGMLLAVIVMLVVLVLVVLAVVWVVRSLRTEPDSGAESRRDEQP